MTYSFYTFIFIVVSIEKCTLVSLDELDLKGPINMKGDHLLSTKKEDIGGRYFPSLERSKRQLIFPVQTLVQLSFCVATPLNLKNRNIYINQGFQLNFALPNVTRQLPSTFLWVPPVINARSRDKRDDRLFPSYSSPSWDEVISQFNDVTTEQVYFFIEKVLTERQYNGSACLLHSICQLAAAPLHQDDDLLHDVMQFILTPSEHGSQSLDAQDKNDFSPDRQDYVGNYYVAKNPTPLEDYLKAEIIGRTMGDCDQFYGGCPSSPLDHLTEIIYEDDEHYKF